MSSAPTSETIALDATWLAQALDLSADQVRLVEMRPADYRAASFLDDRLFQRPMNAQLVGWPAVAAAMGDDARHDARWIFHIGHVGSTLMARLLGEIDGVLAVREPRSLRDIAAASPEERRRNVEPLRKLLSRTFAPDQLALVKATSFVSEIAAELVPPDGRALFMYAAPRHYVASILAGENSLKELEILAPSRAARMAARTGLADLQGSAAHLAAAAWACEMTSLESAVAQMPDRRIAWLDFDQALDAMPAELARTAGFFGFDAEPGAMQAIATGPLMGRYSKALEYDYSAGLRRDLIADATARHRADIDDALAMLERAAETSPLLASALGRAQPEG